MTKTTQAAIAWELGISKAAVSKLKAQGMPTHSADAARRWRAEHLHPARVRPDPGPSPSTLVLRVHELRDVAELARQSGRFELVAGELRAAMRAVPATHRPSIQLPPAMWAALIGVHAMAVLEAGPAASTPEDLADLATPDGDVARTVFALATGEAFMR